MQANFESIMNDIDMAVDFDDSEEDSDGDETVDGDEEKGILMVNLAREIQVLKVRHKQMLETWDRKLDNFSLSPLANLI